MSYSYMFLIFVIPNIQGITMVISIFLIHYDTKHLQSDIFPFFPETQF
jgi:hypothetical protein